MSATYEEIVAKFDQIDSATARDLVKRGDEAVIYIGKSVCPFCQLFVPKLEKVAQETGTHIYHVNSVEKSDMEGIMDFRNEYDIPTVPGLIFTKGDKVNIKCDSSMSEEEIKAFIKE